MPAGRPTKYDPSFCDRVIYGLHDGCGNIFYVGKSASFRKRLSAYRAGRFHGNRGLEAAVNEFGLHWIVLEENPLDMNAAEFFHIEARPGLVNLITDRDRALMFAPSNKPWHVPGVKCPSEQYLTMMRNRFGIKMPDVKSALKAMTDTDRVASERRFAKLLGPKPSIKKWEFGCASA